MSLVIKMYLVGKGMVTLLYRKKNILKSTQTTLYRRKRSVYCEHSFRFKEKKFIYLIDCYSLLVTRIQKTSNLKEEENTSKFSAQPKDQVLRSHSIHFESDYTYVPFNYDEIDYKV